MAENYHAKKLDELLSVEEMASLTGYEFLRGIVEGTYPAPPIAKTLNFHMADVRDGEVTFIGRPEFEAMNPIGSIHGGWFGAILDSCMSCAVQTKLPQGVGYTTLEYKINMLRPLIAGGGEVMAVGKTVHVGRRTGTAIGEVRGVEDGKIYATGSATCLMIDLTA